ncbi:class I SAM-dependent methyltransferase [Rudaeicoccus suwonensis]|uniref:S-adenosyl-L-methionine-dependent methyltransferase n=1 Tax=Rudaeicoccus suwonensis TaxID=657409 RepID=A0A561EAC8_9MICO|nr:SAM-dependent methyltransferase [Rudaeicoccus suwonensis]TWE12547.1 methyltransferase (TIGR00027 family) [Rudaeicoccus suwonensis]
MIPGEPSRTAWSAAMHRAAHQAVDRLSVFDDPVAIPITGWTRSQVQADVADHPERAGMRFFIACRHRFGRDVIAEVGRAGPVQVVVLGAGLDTTAYQPNPDASIAAVFEVDHPATGSWKQDRLAEAGIRATVEVTYVGVDFEHDELGESLAAAALDPAAPVVVLWLGVLIYLTRPAIEATLESLRQLPVTDVHVVFDYAAPTTGDDPVARMRTERATAVAALGEPWQSYFNPQQAAQVLHQHGFDPVEDLDLPDWGARYLRRSAASFAGRRGAHLVHARRNEPATAP